MSTTLLLDETLNKKQLYMVKVIHLPSHTQHSHIDTHHHTFASIVWRNRREVLQHQLPKGRVLHSEETRIMSVREFVNSQDLPPLLTIPKFARCKGLSVKRAQLVWRGYVSGSWKVLEERGDHNETNTAKLALYSWEMIFISRLNFILGVELIHLVKCFVSISEHWGCEEADDKYKKSLLKLKWLILEYTTWWPLWFIEAFVLKVSRFRMRPRVA